MTTFTIQYLEDSPEIADITPQAARARLREAFRRLPISQVLIGWNLPSRLLNACAGECSRAGAELYRWHPLLTGDGTFTPQPKWQIFGVDGQPVPGFQDMPEFTFVCPNRPAVREMVLEHLREVMADNRYQGVFLDRIRYPSPAPDPGRLVGCFCEDCQRVANQNNIDLTETRRIIESLISSPEGAKRYIQTLIDPQRATTPESEAVAAFMAFRTGVVTGLIQEAAAIIRGMNKAVGLDCWSPSLTSIVGQDLVTLNPLGDWTKIMSYGHTLGPAGIPFELLQLADWLVDKDVEEEEAMSVLSGATRLPLPNSRAVLRQQGLPPQALNTEADRARKAGGVVLAGMELVEIPGVAELTPEQITKDVAAFRDAGVDGLALSWDLWRMPLERLTLVNQAWSG